jgi:hypothetical protein
MAHPERKNEYDKKNHVVPIGMIGERSNDPQISVKNDKSEVGHELIQLVHYQQLELEIKLNKGEVESLSGALDLVQWVNLNVIQGAISIAIERAKLCEECKIETRASLVHEGNKWNPMYTMYISGKTITETERNIACSVAKEIMFSLGLNRNNPTNKLEFDGLSDENREIVAEVAEETLSHSGGRDLKSPIAIYIDGDLHLELKGRLAPRPSKADYTPKPSVLTGTFSGFVNDKSSRTLLLIEENIGRIEVNFLESQIKASILNLKSIARLNIKKIKCKITATRTTDHGGKFIYSFVSMKAANDETFQSQTRENDADSKNKVTDKSVTNSNES